MTYDLAIIGAGSAAKAAATEARRLGKSVVMIERSEVLRGPFETALGLRDIAFRARHLVGELNCAMQVAGREIRA